MSGLVIRAALLLVLLPLGARAESLRVAAFDADLTRSGPGLLLHDLEKGDDPQIGAVVAVVRAARADVLFLSSFDHDLKGRALAAFRARLAEGKDGIDYPHVFAAPVNAGLPSGHDLDGDGRVMGWDDNLGWGKFPGHGGLAVLSRLPIEAAAARGFRALPWRDLPGADLPVNPDNTPYPDEAAQAAMRLSSRAHWDLPVILPGGGRLHLLASHPTPPLFDGPEGRNLRRNRDEIGFWVQYLDSTAFADDAGLAAGAPAEPVVVLGNLNLDPADGAGLRGAMQDLLAHPRLRDPRPASEGAVRAAEAQGGANAAHLGDPALDTADFRDAPGPGNLRTDYVLPDARLEIAGAGVLWPAPGEALAAEAEAASQHRLVWVDLVLP